MKEILILGAGNIGEMIASLLAECGDYAVSVADLSESKLADLADRANISTLTLDISDQAALDAAMDGKFAVLSAGPYQLTRKIATAAHNSGLHYLDLTEDVASTRHVKKLAETASHAFIPQCGLAPGFISIVAFDLARKFDKLKDVRLRVGALPEFPSNALKYNLTWSTDGLINEYIQPCEAIVGGTLTELLALEGCEEFSLDGVVYESFNTSGGLGTLSESLEGRVNNLNYQTVRYPGHRDIIKMLVRDLGLGERTDLLKNILEHALPITHQDLVLIFVTVTGWKNGRLVQESYARKVYARDISGTHRTAIQITTASGICAVLDMLATGQLPDRGFVRQEDISFDDFIANRFGANYAYAGDDHHCF